MADEPYRHPVATAQTTIGPGRRRSAGPSRSNHTIIERGAARTATPSCRSARLRSRGAAAWHAGAGGTLHLHLHLLLCLHLLHDALRKEVEQLNVEAPGEFKVSSAEHLLSEI